MGDLKTYLGLLTCHMENIRRFEEGIKILDVSKSEDKNEDKVCGILFFVNQKEAKYADYVLREYARKHRNIRGPAQTVLVDVTSSREKLSDNGLLKNSSTVGWVQETGMLLTLSWAAMKKAEAISFVCDLYEIKQPDSDIELFPKDSPVK